MNIKQRIMNGEHRIMNHKLRNSTFLFPYSIFCLLSSLFCLYFVAGCESPATPKNPLAEQVETLTQDKREMMRQIEHLESKNKDLQKQINTLHDFADDVNLKDLYDVQSIKITKYTNLFDKDKDGKWETLIVYVQPIDQDGDIVKAAGVVDIQLLDLKKDQGPELLGKWRVTPPQLRKLWFNALLKTHYRLTFDVSDKVESYEEPLTVMVTFTDYLSGKVFEEQKLIKPR
jgi:hypothetical protein